MATYTGASTIDAAFESILSQKDPGVEYEIVVVIDGPNKELREKVEQNAKKFSDKKVSFSIEQFSKNKGRFEARLTGARLAKHDYLLIADDRVELPDNYFKTVVSAKEEAVMPDVKEKEAKNFVSMTLYWLRRKIYGDRWNKDFKPYHIDKDNFDKSPKGTAAFWINKKVFIETCNAIAKQVAATKNVNDDTRILRRLVENGIKIYKTSELRIVYEPRQTASAELSHIYHRGPRFIDYYLKPGNRYFLPLILMYALIIPVVIVIAVWPIIGSVILLLTLLLSLWVSPSVIKLPKIMAGAWLVFAFFFAGLVAGLFKKVSGK